MCVCVYMYVCMYVCIYLFIYLLFAKLFKEKNQNAKFLISSPKDNI